MHVVDKLEDRIDSLLKEIDYLKNQKYTLLQEIEELNDINDKLKFNNETMYLNIDKALHIVNDSKEDNDDILYKS
jgi:regulator of replication initiation timing